MLTQVICPNPVRLLRQVECDLSAGVSVLILTEVRTGRRKKINLYSLYRLRRVLENTLHRDLHLFVGNCERHAGIAYDLGLCTPEPVPQIIRAHFICSLRHAELHHPKGVGHGIPTQIAPALAEEIDLNSFHGTAGGLFNSHLKKTATCLHRRTVHTPARNSGNIAPVLASQDIGPELEAPTHGEIKVDHARCIRHFIYAHVRTALRKEINSHPFGRPGTCRHGDCHSLLLNYNLNGSSPRYGNHLAPELATQIVHTELVVAIFKIFQGKEGGSTFIGSGILTCVRTGFCKGINLYA